MSDVIGSSRLCSQAATDNRRNPGLALGDQLFTQIEAQPRFQKDMDAAVTRDQLQTP